MNLKRGFLNIIIGGASSGISFLSVAVLAYYLSKENFSAIISELAFVNLLSTIAILGIAEIIVKYKNHRGNQSISDAILGVFFIQIIIAEAVLIIYSATIKSYPLLELTGLLILVSVFQVKASYHKSEEKYELAAIYSGIAFPLGILIATYFLITLGVVKVNHENIINMVVILGGTMLLIDVAINKSFKNLSYPSLKFEKISIVFKESLRIGYIGFAYSIFMTADIQFLTLYHKSNVGEYKIHSIWTQFVLLPNVVFGAMLTNQYAKFLRDGKVSEVFSVIKKFQIIQLLIALAISIAILILSKTIVFYIFKDKYHIDIYLISIFIIIGLIFTMFGPESVFLTYSNHQKNNIIIISFSILLNILFLTILVPKYGTIGAAVSLLLATFFWAIFVHRSFLVIKNKIH